MKVTNVRIESVFKSEGVNFCSSVHVGPIRQTATITEMSQEHLRTGDKADVRFRFIKNPEYLRAGMRLVFREGKTKAVGECAARKGCFQQRSTLEGNCRVLASNRSL